MFQLKYLLAALMVPAFVLTACTRKNEEITKVGLSIPATVQKTTSLSSKTTGKVSAQFDATLQLSHVIINASAADIPQPLLLSWDRCHDCTIVAPPPGEFFIEIPMGNGRLIQVLAVYKNPNTDSMSFYYGDTIASLNQPQHVVQIPVSDLGGAIQIVSGNIAGRFLTGPDVGPSGVLNIKYTPPGKPSMVIERSHIINGWFNVFALKGLEFSYELADTSGLKLFGGPVSVDSPVFSPTNQILKVSKPIHKRNDSSQWKSAEPEVSILGWFGDSSAISGKSACYNFNTAFTKLSQSGNSTLLTWSGSAPPSNLFTANHPTAHYEGGLDANSNATPCAQTNEYLSQISTSTARLDGRGRESFAGFYSPFQMNSNGEPFTGSQDANSNRILAGTVLPGSLAAIQNIMMFKRIGTDINTNMDQIPCAGIARGDFPGWVQAGIAQIGSDRSFTLNTSISNSDIATGVNSALCFGGPFGVYPFGIGIRADKWGGGGNSGPYMRIEMMTMGGGDGVKPMASNYCYSFQVRTYENGSSFAYSGPAFSIDLLSNGIGGTFYNNSDCTGAATTTIGMSASSNQTTNYSFKATTNSPTGSITAQLGANSGSSVQFNSHTMNVDVQNPVLKVVGPSLASTGECFKARVKLQNHQGIPLNVIGTNLNVPLSLTGISIYSDYYCNTATTSTMTINTNQNIGDDTSIYFKLDSVSGTIHPNLGSYTANDLNVGTRAGSTDYTKIKFEILSSSPYYQGECYDARVSLLNDNDELASTKFSVNIPLQSKFGDFFTEGCWGSGISSVFVAERASFVNLKFRPSSIGALVVDMPSILNSTITVPAYSIAAPVAGFKIGIDLASLPDFKSKIIGSHEFGTEKLIQLNYASGATVNCFASSDNGATWSGCVSSSIDGGKIFHWNVLDAVAGKIFKFEGNYNGYYDSVVFNPKMKYGGNTQFIDNFVVTQCDTVLNGPSLTETDISTAFSGNDTVCINNGATITATSAAVSISSTASFKSLIGWTGNNTTDRTKVFKTAPSTPTVIAYNTFASSTQAMLLANLEIEAENNYAGLSMNSMSPASLTRTRLVNLKIKSNGTALAGIYLFSNKNTHELYMTDIIFDLTSGWEAIRLVGNSASGNNIPSKVVCTNCEVINTTDASEVYGIKLSDSANAPSSIELNSFKMVHPGYPITVNTTNSTANLVAIKSSKIIGSGSIATAPISINDATSGATEFIMENSFFENNNLSGRDGISVSSATSSTKLKLHGNILRQFGNSNLIYIPASPNLNTLSVVSNSFVKVSGTPATGAVFSGPSSINYMSDSVHNAPTPPSGPLGNKVCYQSTSTWAPGASMSGTYTLPASFTATLLSNGGCP